MDQKRVYYYEDDRIKVAESLARYEFALGYVGGRSVLDIGCGARRGPRLLSEQASSVVGVDISQEALDHCQRTWPSPRVHYRVADATALPFGDGAFDVVTAFEVVEHLSQQDVFIREVHRVLKNGGTLILSTPNRIIMSPDGVFSNPDHVYEFDLSELEKFLAPFFVHVEFYGQASSEHIRQLELARSQSYASTQRIPVFLRHLVPRTGRDRLFRLFSNFTSKTKYSFNEKDVTTKDFPITRDRLDQAKYMVAVCGK